MTEDESAQFAAMQLVIANLRGVICEVANELIAAKGATPEAIDEVVNLVHASAQKAIDKNNDSPSALALVIKLTEILLRPVEPSLRATAGKKGSVQ